MPAKSSKDFQFTTKNVLSIIGLIIAGILVFVAIPSIEVKMFIGNENFAPTNTYDNSNVKIFLDKDGEDSSDSRVCFNINNRAQKYGDYDLPANNFIVKIETTATCKDCELRTDFKDFHAQTNKELCKFVRSSDQSIEFKIISTYDVTVLHPTHIVKYVCELQDDTKYRNEYLCNLGS